jgi:mono/diheme cytochrome c family protein
MRSAAPARQSIGAILLATALAGLGACVGGASDPASHSESEATGWSGAKLGKNNAEMIAEGRRIAERECASCHAMDQSSVSPPRGAPPLRDLLFLNDPDLVAYRLIDAVRMGHDNMPLFDFDVRAADALIAYLETLNSREE